MSHMESEQTYIRISISTQAPTFILRHQHLTQRIYQHLQKPPVITEQAAHSSCIMEAYLTASSSSLTSPSFVSSQSRIPLHQKPLWTNNSSMDQYTHSIPLRPLTRAHMTSRIRIDELPILHSSHYDASSPSSSKQSDNEDRTYSIGECYRANRSINELAVITGFSDIVTSNGQKDKENVWVHLTDLHSSSSEYLLRKSRKNFNIPPKNHLDRLRQYAMKVWSIVTRFWEYCHDR